MRLSDGTLWPIPVTLDVPDELAAQVGPGASVALRDPEGVMLAALHVEEVWEPDRRAEAQAVFGTTDPAHPGVAHLLERTHPVYVAGPLEGIQLPAHYDFLALRHDAGGAAGRVRPPGLAPGGRLPDPQPACTVPTAS